MIGIFEVGMFCQDCHRYANKENVKLEMGKKRGFGCKNCGNRTEIEVPFFTIGGSYLSHLTYTNPAIGFSRKV